MDDVLDLHDEGEELFNAEELDVKVALGDGVEANEEMEDNEDKQEIKKEADGGEAEGDGEGDDLYDAAMEPSGLANNAAEKRGELAIEDATAASAGATIVPTSFAPTTHGYARRWSCYVGNMTWWTTDADLERAVQGLGLSDIVEIRFYESRATGQSKGFALLAFSSEQSLKIATEKLPQIKLQEQALVVLPYSRHSLAKFEEATKKMDNRDRERKEEKSVLNVGTVRIGATGAIAPLATSLSSMARQPQPTSLMNLNPFIAPLQPLQPQATTQPMRPPLVAPLPLQALLPSLPRLPTAAPPVNLAVGGPQPSEMNLNRPPPTFLPTVGSVGSNTGQLPPTPLMATRPPGMAAPGGGFAGAIVQQQPLLTVQPGLPPGAHINPQVYPTFAQSFGHPTNSENGGHMGGGGGLMSEAEFDEIMNRNRTVSSSAIGRAVSDAATGDFSSAIDTLSTAISLIRQSRIAHDDRCKALIASLQDTLQGIESKSYNGRRHRSGRDRSRSPDRSGRSKRHRRSSRSRSRSRDRYDYSPMGRSGRRY